MTDTDALRQAGQKETARHFNTYRDAVIIKDHVKSKHIYAGDFSYYAGYYHGRPFDDCVMYLDEGDDIYPPEATDRLIIGKFCSFATGVKFMMGGNQGHNHNWIASYPLDFLDDDFDGYVNVPPKALCRKGDTVIGNDVWIGAEAVIMPGVSIGDGAVIGTRSIVTKDVGAYEVRAGCPARLIKKRFTDTEIERLLMIRWWNRELGEIKANLHLLRSGDVEKLWQSMGAAVCAELHTQVKNA